LARRGPVKYGFGRHDEDTHDDDAHDDGGHGGDAPAAGDRPPAGTARVSGTLATRLRRLAAGSPTPFAVVFADGERLVVGDAPAAVTIRFRTRRAQWRTLAFKHIGLLEAWFDGDVDFDGDLGAMFALGMYSDFDTPTFAVALRNRWHELRHSNASPARAKDNARFHYGLGFEFYRQWLDVPLMMYTCAYWDDGVADVEQAQAAKIDHVCRKLRLAPGERVVDVGCGFGGFMFRAAQRCGVTVAGLNTTTEQVVELRERIAREGMSERLSVVEADFRDPVGEFDKVVSIGTLEHAGRDQLDEVVAAHARLLRPGGLGMLHFIGHVGEADTEFFIRRHVFPGGWIPSLARTIESMERHGLEVVDVENLRRHYALTLDAWAQRFQARWDTIRAIDPKRFDERFRRVWLAYLVGCAEMFRSPHGRTHLFQVVFSKGNVDRRSYPMSRRFLYGDGGAGKP
jgi:cyclopropane-fatty-acyl-phospholipid synthase